MEKRPLILISNDDGYLSKGITELVRMLSDMGEIIVCAPEGAQSGKSRAFSFSKMRLRRLAAADFQEGLGGMPVMTENVSWWACNGTPVDCVKMAYGILCDRRPDLVVGGINHGDNASTNAHYSGTIGVVFEGAMKGIPSVAFSLCDYAEDADFRPMEGLVRSIAGKVLAEGLPHLSCLNVNVPKVDSASELRGVRVCRMADGYWRRETALQEGCTDAEGRQQYCLEGYYESCEPDADDTDAWALRHGYAAVTPCTIDITDYQLAERLRSWKL